MSCSVGLLDARDFFGFQIFDMSIDNVGSVLVQFAKAKRLFDNLGSDASWVALGNDDFFYFFHFKISLISIFFILFRGVQTAK